MVCRQAAHEFIDAAFDLLDEYKENTSFRYGQGVIEDKPLQKPFYLRINRNGFLHLLEKTSDGMVKKTYFTNNNYSFVAGDLLSQYISALY